MRITTALALILASSAHAEEVKFLDLSDFASADVVIVGEVHDNPDHHLTQAALIALLAPKAVVFEMLNAEQAALITDETVNAPDLGTLLGWAESGWPDFTIYAPIFASLNGAAVVGARPDEATRALARENGAVVTFGAAAGDYGLDRPLPLAQQEMREGQMQNNHCGALPAAMLPWFVTQQRFADASFSRATLEALDTFGSPVVVVTGNGHARTDWGMPVYLTQAAPDVDVISFGQITEPATDAPYDLWQVTAPAPSDGSDPCAAFK